MKWSFSRFGAWSMPVLALALLVVFPFSGNAETIFLSGETNIVNGLDGVNRGTVECKKGKEENGSLFLSKGQL